jgi:thymidine phosphorylase
MNEPLASAAGNALEVANAVDFLTGRSRDKRLLDVTLALAAEMLQSAGIARSNQEGLLRANDALDRGQAAEVFGRMVSALGGPPDFVERSANYLPAAPVVRPVMAARAGFVAGIATREIGLAVISLGGGRRRPQDAVDHAVGLTALRPVGAEIREGEPLAIIHARSDADADAAAATLRAVYRISESRPAAQKSVLRRIISRD